MQSYSRRVPADAQSTYGAWCNHCLTGRGPVTTPQSTVSRWAGAVNAFAWDWDWAALSWTRAWGHCGMGHRPALGSAVRWSRIPDWSWTAGRPGLLNVLLRAHALFPPDAWRPRASARVASARPHAADNTLTCTTAQLRQQGIPLRCVMCDVLLLNRTIYTEHVGSKVCERGGRDWREGQDRPGGALGRWLYWYARAPRCRFSVIGRPPDGLGKAGETMATVVSGGLAMSCRVCWVCV